MKMNIDIAIKSYYKIMFFCAGYDVISQRDKKKSPPQLSPRNSQNSITIDGFTFEELENCAVEIDNNDGSDVEKELNSVAHTRSGRLVKSKKPWSPSKPSTSGLNINLAQDYDSDEDIDDTQPCCVCKQQSPPNLKQTTQLVIVNWAKCCTDSCDHWVHLKFCHLKEKVSRTENFYCPCCEQALSEQ